VGNVLGYPGKLPDIYNELEINFFLLRRLIGVKAEGGNDAAKISKIAKSETLKFNVGSTETPGRVNTVKEKSDESELVNSNLHKNR